MKHLNEDLVIFFSQYVDDFFWITNWMDVNDLKTDSWKEESRFFLNAEGEHQTVHIWGNVQLRSAFLQKHACILVHLQQAERPRVNTFSRVTWLLANIILPLALLLIPLFSLLFLSSLVDWSYDDKQWCLAASLALLPINPPYNPLQLARPIRSNVRRG